MSVQENKPKMLKLKNSGSSFVQVDKRVHNLTNERATVEDDRINDWKDEFK